MNLNLQLFAEEGAMTGGAPSVTATPDTAPTAPSPSTEATAAPQQEQPSIGLVTDPQTGRKRIVTEETQPNQTQDNTTPAPQPQAAQETAPEGLINTQPYTLDQINEAIRKGNVDERRIGPEFRQQYAEYKLKQAQKAEQQRQEQLKWQEEQQKAAMEQQRQLLATIDVEAKKRAMQMTGVTQDDLNTAEYSDDEQQKAKVEQYKSAVEWNRLQMLNSIQQQNVQQAQAMQQQRALYQSILDFATQKQQTEPHYDEINKLLATHYQDMPYKEAQAIANAVNAMNNGNVTEDQCKILEKYYDDTRAYYYAQANDLSKQPKKIPIPKVEQPGTGAATPPKPVDFTAMRGMTMRQRRDFLANWAHGKN